MIRRYKIEELETVLNLWLQTNLAAHDFIAEEYWRGNYELVKKMLPDAAIYVYEESHVILGFIGLTGNYIAGLFVDAQSQSKGIGKALLDSVKNSHSELSLHVYKKNGRAVKFYRREGFAVSGEQTEESTGETELVMNWAESRGARRR